MHARIQRGTGGPESHGKLQKYRVLNNTDPDPLKITKLPSQHSLLGHHRPTSETPLSHHRHISQTPFKWRFAGPLIVVFGFLKKRYQSWPPLIKLFGSAHAAMIGNFANAWQCDIGTLFATKLAILTH